MNHGVQCGFCTPGMVMSMYALLRSHPLPSVSQMERALEGETFSSVIHIFNHNIFNVVYSISFPILLENLQLFSNSSNLPEV